MPWAPVAARSDLISGILDGIGKICWLAPIEEETHAQDRGSVGGPATMENSVSVTSNGCETHPPQSTPLTRRASNRGCLPMPLDQ